MSTNQKIQFALVCVPFFTSVNTLANGTKELNNHTLKRKRR